MDCLDESPISLTITRWCATSWRTPHCATLRLPVGWGEMREIELLIAAMPTFPTYSAYSNTRFLRRILRSALVIPISPRSPLKKLCFSGSGS